jgi:hypothetical protein
MHLTKGTVSLQSNWDSSGGVVTTLWPQRLIYIRIRFVLGARGFSAPEASSVPVQMGCGAPLLRINRRGCAPHHSPKGSYVVKNTWSHTSIYT